MYMKIKKKKDSYEKREQINRLSTVFKKKYFSLMVVS